MASPPVNVQQKIAYFARAARIRSLSEEQERGERARGVQRRVRHAFRGGADCLSRCEALGSPLADSTTLNVIHALGFWEL